MISCFTLTLPSLCLILGLLPVFVLFPVPVVVCICPNVSRVQLSPLQYSLCFPLTLPFGLFTSPDFCSWFSHLCFSFIVICLFPFCQKAYLLTGSVGFPLSAKSILNVFLSALPFVCNWFLPITQPEEMASGVSAYSEPRLNFFACCEVTF